MDSDLLLSSWLSSLTFSRAKSLSTLRVSLANSSGFVARVGFDLVLIVFLTFGFIAVVDEADTRNNDAVEATLGVTTVGIVTGEADTGDDVGAVETIGVITGEDVDNVLARGKDETVATGILTNGTEAGHVVGRAEPDQDIVETIDVSIIVNTTGSWVVRVDGWNAAAELFSDEIGKQLVYPGAEELIERVLDGG